MLDLVDQLKTGWHAKHGPKKQRSEYTELTGEGNEDRMRRVFELLRELQKLCGGENGLTWLVIDQLKRAADKSNRGRDANAFLAPDVLSRLLADASLFKLVKTMVGKLTRAPISRFMFAQAKRGLTVAGMDALRFAMSWCPGHSTLLKFRREFLSHVTSAVPAGAAIENETHRTEKEQEEDAAHEAQEEQVKEAQAQKEAEEEARAHMDSTWIPPTR